MKFPILATTLAIAMTVLAGGVHAGGDPKNGREISIKHCSRCHVIGDYNRFGGIGSTPSFQWLTKVPDYEDRLRTFYARPPHPAYVRVPGVPPLTDLPPFITPLTVTGKEIEDIVAFVKTLKMK